MRGAAASKIKSEQEGAKAPQRARGQRRVKELLAAASDLFVEKGFDATTMTEIAQRAGAAIGSLYQFFPNKEALADVLCADSGDFMCQEWAKLRDNESILSAEELVDQLVSIASRMTNNFPSFVPLYAVRGRPGVNLQNARIRMARIFDSLLEAKLPKLTKSDIKGVSIVVREMLRFYIDVGNMAASTVSRRAKFEIRDMLVLYVQAKM